MVCACYIKGKRSHTLEVLLSLSLMSPSNACERRAFCEHGPWCGAVRIQLHSNRNVILCYIPGPFFVRVSSPNPAGRHPSAVIARIFRPWWKDATAYNKRLNLLQYEATMMRGVADTVPCTSNRASRFTSSRTMSVRSSTHLLLLYFVRFRGTDENVVSGKLS